MSYLEREVLWMFVTLGLVSGLIMLGAWLSVRRRP